MSHLSRLLLCDSSRLCTGRFPLVLLLECMPSKKKKPGRAQTIEEIFASVSNVTAAGLNLPPQRVVLTPRSARYI